MKYCVLLALLGNTKAVKLNSRWIDGYESMMNDDNDFAVMQLQKETDAAVQFASNVEGATPAPEDHSTIGTHTDIRQKSDPIYGSAGKGEWESKPDHWMSDAQRMEYDLTHMTPIKYSLDPSEHPETKDSIEWAEGLTGHTMATPPREHDAEDKSARYDLHPDEDDDVSDTLKSTHQAEIELGYHHLHQNNTISEYNGDSSFHNSKTYFENGFQKSSRFRQKDDLGGEYDGAGYGEDHHNGANKEWWKHLEKDRYDGMRYVDQKKSQNLDEVEYKGKPLEFEIEGLNMESPSKKETTEDEDTDKKKKKKVAKDEDDEEKPKKEKDEEEEPKKEKKQAKESAPEEKPPKEETAAPAESKKAETGQEKAAGFVPPELDTGNAMVQKPKGTIDVDGEAIPIDTEMTGVVEDDPESADYLQVQEEQGESVMTGLSNQMRLEQYMRSS